MILSLTGFMGVGKSTIAASLAKHLYCNHLDLDTYLENLNDGQTIEEIFRNIGEENFRYVEEIALEKLLQDNKEKVLVLSLGGGALISHKNRELILNQTKCIYLKASLETLNKRLEKSRKQRPLVKYEEGVNLKETITSLYQQREEGYNYCAAITIEVDHLSLKEILIKILASI